MSYITTGQIYVVTCAMDKYNEKLLLCLCVCGDVFLVLLVTHFLPCLLHMVNFSSFEIIKHVNQMKLQCGSCR